MRAKINGTADSPRVCVTKKVQNLYIQAIDDVTSNTLFSVSSFGKNSPVKSLNKETVDELGQLLLRNPRSAILCPCLIGQVINTLV